MEGRRRSRPEASDSGGGQLGAVGSTERRSSLAGRLTNVLAGWAVMSSAGRGASGTSWMMTEAMTAAFAC